VKLLTEMVERKAYRPYGAYDADYRPQRWNYNCERHMFGGHWDNLEAGLIYGLGAFRGGAWRSLTDGHARR
jgi:hypothetical protein